MPSPPLLTPVRAHVPEEIRPPTASSATPAATTSEDLISSTPDVSDEKDSPHGARKVSVGHTVLQRLQRSKLCLAQQSGGHAGKTRNPDGRWRSDQHDFAANRLVGCRARRGQFPAHDRVSGQNRVLNVKAGRPHGVIARQRNRTIGQGIHIFVSILLIL